jgi:hypothetical protein
MATAGGVSCVVICTNVQDSEVVKFDLECRSRAPNCAAADRCEAATLNP